MIRSKYKAMGDKRRSGRSGFTLVEMLVVIVILGLLTSIALPLMSAASDSRRMREGARLLSSAFAAAQAKAIATGRSTGVIIERMGNNSTAGMQVFQAEVPPPYIGDTLTSTAQLSGGQLLFPSSDTGWKTVRSGDLVRLNYRGAYFMITTPNGPNGYIPNSIVALTPTDPTRIGDPNLYPRNTNSISFQVFRQPIKTADSVAVMVDGACVDFSYSGIDQYGTGASFAPGGSSPATDVSPVTVTFGPSGNLERVYAQGNALSLPLTGVYLLVGKIEKTYAISSYSQPNYLDSDARWVFVSRQSGLPTTTENAYIASPGSPPNATDVNNARRYATAAQNSSGA
jgi:prepilin-type N-terminal cleavage/methylation domain-containing protein